MVTSKRDIKTTGVSEEAQVDGDGVRLDGGVAGGRCEGAHSIGKEGCGRSEASWLDSSWREADTKR